MIKTRIFFLCAALALCAAACKPKTGNGAGREIAVFIPGALAASPTYEALAAGAREAADEAENVSITVVEAGYNQAEWEPKLTALAASERYELIISSNPSLPDIARAVAAKFPRQRFMLFDGELNGDPSIYTLNYDKTGQAWILGYLAALISEEASASKVGLLIAQRYPVMDEVIIPSFEAGAREVNPALKLDMRVTGSWQDAAKALELAGDMISGGVKVILTITGAGNDGVLAAAEERGAKVLWFDANAYSYRPGVIAGCCVTYQKEAVTEKLRAYLRGGLVFGAAETAGFSGGFIDFADTDPLYLSTVSAPIRAKMSEKLAALRAR